MAQLVTDTNDKGTAGHATLPQKLLLERVAALAIEPAVQVDEDLIAALRKTWERADGDEEPDPELVFHTLSDGSFAVQTRHREEITKTIRNLSRRVRRLKRHSVSADWAMLLNQNLPADDGSAREKKAREPYPSHRQLIVTEDTGGRLDASKVKATIKEIFSV